MKVFCKFCQEETEHELVKTEVNEGIPIIYLKCKKCNSINMYGFIGTEFIEEE